MTPIVFTRQATLPIAPARFAEMILDVSRWPSFRGYGPIPGIALAAFEVRTPGFVGSRIRVVNKDGSRHVEEIIEWRPETKLRLRMGEFSPPLSRLADHFIETMDLEPVAAGTKVTRSFAMHATSASARVVLWVASFFLKRAVDRHFADIAKSLQAIA